MKQCIQRCRLSSKTSKKWLSVILATVLFITSCSIGFFVNAQDKKIEINKEILESIFEERPWIIDTLVNGDISTNPYAEVNTSATDESIMHEVLTNYQNNKAFRTLVNALETYSNPEDFLENMVDEDVLADFTEWFGSDVQNAVGALLTSKNALKYESIINEVLQTDYTASWGDTLFAQNMDLENLKQKAEIFNKLSTYQKTLSEFLNLSLSETSAVVIYNPNDIQYASYQMDIQDYVDHLLSAYSTDLEAYLNSVIEIPGLDGNEALKQKIVSVGALGMISLCEQIAIPETSANLDDIFYDGMFEDTMKILGGVGKVLDLVNKSFDYAILLEALQSQKSTTVAAMSRVAENTSDYGLKAVFNSYASMVDEQGDELTINYEDIVDYLMDISSTGITNLVAEKVSQQAPLIVSEAFNKFFGANGLVMQNGISSALTKAGKIASITLWVADQTTGIQDTAKKIYICKYVDKMIDEIAKTYESDMYSYLANSSDENAQKVLSDLQLLKELRLYGEKAAYGSMCAQMDSWIGLLLGGGDTREYLDRRYQSSIDTYLGCSLSPLSNKPFKLSAGDELSIITEDVNGKNYCTATLRKADGGYTSFAEADLRMLGGLDLNGATLNIYSADNGFYLPLIENDTDGSKINIYCDNASFGEISNSATLDIGLFNKAADFEITDAIKNSGTLNITNSSAASKITVYDIVNAKNMSISGIELYAKGAVDNSGSISGKLHLCGDGSLGYDNAYFAIRQQTVSGGGTCSDLYFENNLSEGVLFSEDMTVTGTVSNTSTRVKNTANLILTGGCRVAGDHLNSGATLQDFSSSQALAFEDMVNIRNKAALGAACTFNDSLCLTSACTELSQNGITVKGDLVIDGGVLTGSGSVDLRGDLNVSTSSAVINNLRLCGLQPQNVAGNAFTVGTLVNNNYSVGGVTWDATVYVTDLLDDRVISPCKNGENIVLTGTASAAGGKIGASVSAKDWTCATDLTVSDTLYTSGTIVLPANVQLDVGGYEQSSGNFALEEGAVLNCKHSYQNAAPTANAGTIRVQEDSTLSAELSGGTFEAGGDISASAAFSPNNLYFDGSGPQSFNNSGETNVKTLSINNSSKSGFTVGSVIYVSETFTNNCKNLINPQNIVLTGTGDYNNPQENDGDVNTSGAFVVQSGETLVIGGDLNLQSGASLTVEDGGTLLVKGHLTGSSANITVANGGTLTVNDYMSLSSTAWNVAGEMTVKSDVKLLSCTVDSAGTIKLLGDLNTSSCTWTNANLSFVGQTPQVVSGSAVTVNKLVITNRSKSGITFETQVTYQTIDAGSSVIEDSGNLTQNS